MATARGDYHTKVTGLGVIIVPFGVKIRGLEPLISIRIRTPGRGGGGGKWTRAVPTKQEPDSCVDLLQAALLIRRSPLDAEGMKIKMTADRGTSDSWI